MDKNKWVYVGIGAFFLLVILNSRKKNVQLTPVEEIDIPDNKNIEDINHNADTDNTNTLVNFNSRSNRKIVKRVKKNFDSSTLPVFLKPPNRLNEGENIPKLNVPKRVLGFNMTPKKRFDI